MLKWLSVWCAGSGVVMFLAWAWLRARQRLPDRSLDDKYYQTDRARYCLIAGGALAVVALLLYLMSWNR